MTESERHPKYRLQYNLVLAAFVGIMFLLNYYQQTMFFRPGSIHQWRQSDCLSITKNYYEEGMDFFQPRLHYQGVEDGKAVSECPLLNYSVAVLWNVFGEHEFIYRLLEYALLLAAVFVLFNTLLRRTFSFWLSFFAAGTILTSPLLVYYGLNFIADVPALSMATISFCCLYNFSRSGRMSGFYLALAFGTLGVLMKASALLPLCLTLFAGFTALLKTERFRITAHGFSRRVSPLIVMSLVILIVLAWYNYAIAYNNNNRNNIFLLTVLPIWEMEEQQIIYNLKMLFNSMFPLFLNKAMFLVFFILVFYVASNFRKLSLLLRWAFLASGLYFMFYLLFFFQVFTVHDYYLINIFIFPVITLFCASVLFADSQMTVKNIVFVRIFISAALLFSGFHAAAVYRLRTVEDDKMVYWFPFISEEEMGLAKYRFWSYANDIKKLEHFTPVLRKAGIKREDKVLSIPDHSFDISLYLLDQKGYTVARDHLMNDSTVMDTFIHRVQYVVLSDTGLKNVIAFQRILPQVDLFFTHGSVQVFKVRKKH